MLFPRSEDHGHMLLENGSQVPGTSNERLNEEADKDVSHCFTAVSNSLVLRLFISPNDKKM